ncbi:hypothetical protein I317_03451 [Kwoniella heveanensis CBS 569]|uniref:Uncharacterized protein n=1 Tax=Kwoniella heveanensis BCC8398 TaxID=1296120 RepID=A0A1B9H3P1_9TREE|nr:hypothetical protein I316_00110 [Kwoniella heveanensis BCC8398]OCF42720.1 hypothetical protein I317_03451 [Kwoniella heveanensis CBS 569]
MSSTSRSATPPQYIRSRARLENSLTPYQLQLISFALFVAIFPVTWCIYLHWRSMRRRYPSTSASATTTRQSHARAQAQAQGQAHIADQDADRINGDVRGKEKGE